MTGNEILNIYCWKTVAEQKLIITRVQTSFSKLAFQRWYWYVYIKYQILQNMHQQWAYLLNSKSRDSLLHRLLPAVFQKPIFELKDICATNCIAQSKNKQICLMRATAIYLGKLPSLRFNSNLSFLVSFYRITYGWRANFEVTCGVEELFGS